MPETDYTKFLADFWAKSGSTLSAAQEQIFKDMAQRMGDVFTFPLQAFTGRSANLGEAGESLRELVESSLRLSQALGPAAVKTEAADEGPKLADLGNIERKFVVLMNAWSEVRAQSARHSEHVLRAWSKAAAEFAGKLNEAIAKGESLGTRTDTINMWVETANRHLLVAQRSPPFLETQRKLLQASSNLRIAQQDIGDFYNELLGMPTRSEIDDLSKTVAELKREIRADRRRRRASEVQQKTT